MVGSVHVGVDVSRLDVHDDAEGAAAYAVVRASQDHQRPWNDRDGFEPTLRDWRFDDPAQRAEMWAARDGGAVVGIAQLWFPLLDNVDKLWFDIDVAPDRRGRGVGAALVDLVVRRAREEGRRELLGEAFVPPDATGGHPHERFATRWGFTPASTDKVRHLTLPVPTARLDALAGAARPRWAEAYRLETHVGGLPEPLVAGYCRVSNQLGVDAPTGDVEFEAESMTPEHYRAYLDLERLQGRVRLTTVAVEEATGAVVAYTDLVLPSGAPTQVWQWGTLVDREHRGHRLGTAVKVENLRRLQQDHPERTVVGTGNDETNAWMVSINEALGFELVELCRMYHRVLATDGRD
ncbi:MAG: GNAT family N-acetyltransferase [Lapillicoccus sp.]